MDLKGKNIIITGANRGIGLALAQKAAREGMYVHAVCRSPGADLVDEIKGTTDAQVKTWSLDMGKPEQIDKFVQDFLDAGFEPHVLVNNAGQLTGGLIENQDTAKIYSMFQVNLVGLIHLTKLFIPAMLKLPAAKLVNNASVSGVMFMPCASTYAASKAGVVAFTESLRNELKGTSVSTLTMITPGVKTRMFDEIPDMYSGHLDIDKFLSSIPAEQWIDRVFDHIESDKDRVWPKGQSYFGVKMGQHFPKVLGRIVDGYFQR